MTNMVQTLHADVGVGHVASQGDALLRLVHLRVPTLIFLRWAFVRWHGTLLCPRRARLTGHILLRHKSTVATVQNGVLITGIVFVYAPIIWVVIVIIIPSL